MRHTRASGRPHTQQQASKTIAIDVDGTLIVKGELNKELATWARDKKQDGYEVILWTARGKQHAIDTAARHSITDHFSVITGKPMAIVDDKGWTWIKYTKVLLELF